RRLGEPLPHQQANPPRARPRPEAEATLFRPARKPDGASGINPGFPGLFRCRGWITHVLLTRSPLSPEPKPWFSLDLHVLSAPPAFVLSQDQTLREVGLAASDGGTHRLWIPQAVGWPSFSSSLSSKVYPNRI